MFFFSNLLWTFIISQKSQVYPCFQKIRANINTQFQWKIKTIQSDNDHEYFNSNFWKICEINGVSFCLFFPSAYSRNDKSKQKICSINNIFHMLFIQAYLPQSFWHHIFWTFYQEKLSSLSHPLRCCIKKTPLIHIYEYLDVCSIHFFHLLYINFNLTPHHCLSWVSIKFLPHPLMLLKNISFHFSVLSFLCKIRDTWATSWALQSLTTKKVYLSHRKVCRRNFYMHWNVFLQIMSNIARYKTEDKCRALHSIWGSISVT